MHPVRQKVEVVIINENETSNIQRDEIKKAVKPTKDREDIAIRNHAAKSNGS
jgi:hypothetical protein